MKETLLASCSVRFKLEILIWQSFTRFFVKSPDLENIRDKMPSHSDNFHYFHEATDEQSQQKKKNQMMKFGSCSRQHSKFEFRAALPSLLLGRHEFVT